MNASLGSDPVGVEGEVKPVAWSLDRLIHDDDGTPIGTDETRVVWGAECPDPYEGWAPLYSGPMPPSLPEVTGLHPATAELVRGFSEALGTKLAAAEKKYGYSDGWAEPGWMDECRAELLKHVEKGDPRDVAAYCAFLWHHGERTTPPPSPAYPEEVVRLVKRARTVSRLLTEDKSVGWAEMLDEALAPFAGLGVGGA